jgi:uncharacterized protein YdaU (DUF1376 family)
LNYYPHHIGDYLRDTAHLTALEDGTYRRLLDLYYASEKPLPVDLNWLCKLVRAHTDDERQAVSDILKQFWFRNAQGWTNKRADEEIKKGRVRIKTARTNGKKATQRVSQRVSQQQPSGLQGCEPNGGTPNPINQNQKKEQASPPDGGSTVWDFGKSILTEQGLSTKSAGAVIGSWLRDWSEADVAEALRAAAGKADVKAYVLGVLRNTPKRSKKPAGDDLQVAMP